MKTSASVPLPDRYGAVLFSPSRDSRREGGFDGSCSMTRSSNATVMLIIVPAEYEAFRIGEDTPSTDAGQSLTSWTAPSLCAAISEYVRPPASNTARPSAPPSASNPPGSPSLADPSAMGVPSGLMRISWMPLSPDDGARAYVQPPISNTAAFIEPPIESNPPVPLTAEPALERVPLGWMRTIWMALSADAVTTA